MLRSTTSRERPLAQYDSSLRKRWISSRSSRAGSFEISYDIFRGEPSGRWVTFDDMRTNALDHVALWVADRDPLAEFLTGHLGMHVIDKTDAFTLVGSDARKGKLTLFDAEGPREPGALERVVLRVSDLDAALAKLPGELEVERPSPGLATFEAPEGLGLGLTAGEGDGPEYDIDHVLLRVPDPER